MFFLKPRFLIPLALLSGLVASYSIHIYLKKQEAKLKQGTEDVQPVVIVSRNLGLGHVFEERDLMIRDYPLSLVPAGAFITTETVVGRVLKTDVVLGEPILESKLAPIGSSGGVTSLIPAGMRAMTVAVNVVSGVGGFILPNSKVDILATVNPTQSTRGRTTSKIILQGVTVLAVDQTYNKKDNDPVTVKSVTLLVTPEQGEKLALASEEGKLQLVLRSDVDSEEYRSRGVRLDQLLANPAPVRRRTTSRSTSSSSKPKEPEVVVTPPEPPKPKVVEVIRSNVRSEVTFDAKSDSGGE